MTLWTAIDGKMANKLSMNNEGVLMKKEKLRSGYTTGTCAAIAAKAATKMIFLDEELEWETIVTPKGVPVSVKLSHIKRQENRVSCAVKKDAGDDPDITNGILVYASVELTDKETMEVDGGVGVGRITKPGLTQKIGEAAINPMPKAMIEHEVGMVLKEQGYHGGAKIIISVPQGEEIAKKTFNPRLGIEGGISILGTSGIVEPMSQQALVDTIQTELNVRKAEGVKQLVITPGNYGEDFIRDSLHLNLNQAVKCSNFVGQTIDMAVEMEFESILLVGHIGKFVKLAAGIMNTHSHQADGRMEIFTAHAALAGVPVEILQVLMECISADEAVKTLKESGYLDDTMERILRKVEFHLRERCHNQIPIGAVLFSNLYGILGTTGMAAELLKCNGSV